MGGHFVTGHVDAVGTIVNYKQALVRLVGFDPHCFGPLKYRLEFGPNDYRWVSEID